MFTHNLSDFEIFITGQDVLMSVCLSIKRQAKDTKGTNT